MGFVALTLPYPTQLICECAAGSARQPCSSRSRKSSPPALGMPMRCRKHACLWSASVLGSQLIYVLVRGRLAQAALLHLMLSLPSTLGMHQAISADIISVS